MAPSRYVEGLPELDRCLVMGVVNVTPDSFSDGGKYFDTDRAVSHGLALVRAGADLVDVGGESTRPGARRPSEDEELGRVLPVVAGLHRHGVLTSVDTMRAGVADSAVRAGAGLVNDVSGGLADPEMLPAVARMGVPYVLMHWRAHSESMQQHTSYGDVVADVASELQQQLAAAVAVGVRLERVALDPGIGFSKTPVQNWEVLAGLDRLLELGRPVLVATSRKRFLGELLGEAGSLRPPAQRDAATAATTVLAAAAGAWCVRVHDVQGSADAVRVAARWRRQAGRSGGGGDPQ